MSFTNGATGGSYKHKISEEESTVRNLIQAGVSGFVTVNWGSAPANTDMFYKNNRSSGPNQSAMSLVQPYIVTYFWRRTA